MDEGTLDFGHAFEMSVARGSIHDSGPTAVWFRLLVPFVAEAALYDERGRIGRSVQSLLLGG